MLVFGYGCLGLLVGFLTGLTSSPITTTILASLFTLVGSSVPSLLKDIDGQRKIVGSLLASFCLACLLGVVTGVGVKVNRVLDIDPFRVSDQSVYLKSATASEIDGINLRYKNKELSAEQAYEMLWNAVHR